MSAAKQTGPQRMLDILRQHRFILTVTLRADDDWSLLGALLEEAQIGVLELMLRSSQAWTGLSNLRRRYPKLLLGVGTVLSVEQLQRAEDAGADFAVSPGSLPELMTAAAHKNFAYLPGAMTPTDLMQAIQHEHKAVKLFPAAPLGLAACETLLAPFSDLSVCASGGLQADNFQDWLAMSQVSAVSGSWPLASNLHEASAQKATLAALAQVRAALKLG